jgi:hypothetical protein
MSERPAPGDALEVVRGLLRGDDRDHAAGTFMRGLTLGALIGAAIAGSALWQRRGRRGHVEPEGGLTVVDDVRTTRP